MVNVLYSTSATATGAGRAGKTALDDGSMSANLMVPRELGGPGGSGLNPEQLFAMGYAACFMGALRNVARRKGVSLPEDCSVNADIGIGPRDDGAGYGLTATISVRIDGMDRTAAHDLLAAAHVVCPYSHALTKGLDVKTILL
jgi:Ohr subfamily peroxiredoxin